MTRRIDRVHELRRAADEPLFTERRQAVDEAAAVDLREVLGIPSSMSIEFSQASVLRPDAANDAANQPADVEDPE